MKYSIAQIKALVASYVQKNKIANTSYTETHNNLVGLLDKIGKIVTLDTSFVDKLAFFDGEDLPFGKTIEEWQQDLILPEDYDPTGAGALSPHYPTYRPVAYSYTLGRKKLPTTIKNNDVERAVNNEAEFVSVTAMNTKRLQDSYASYRYEVKREILAKLIEKCDDAYEGNAFSASTSYAVGVFLRDKSSDATAWGIVVKPITASESATSTWKKCVDAGYIIVLDLIEEVAIPVDTSTGEAFVKKVKEAVEVSEDISEGHSLNGNTLGASNGLVLLVKQGVMPTLEVDVEAGAFHLDKIAIPAETHVIKDFGSDDTDVYAILCDKRAIKLHTTYRALREQMNADGDFLNLFQHTEDTAFISLNTFVKVFRKPA